MQCVCVCVCVCVEINSEKSKLFEVVETDLFPFGNGTGNLEAGRLVSQREAD